MNRAIIASMLAAAHSLPTFAQSAVEEADGWSFEVTPYLFAAGLDGTVALRGVTADVDMSFSDIWDRLDSGFMSMVEARKGKWMFAFDGLYIDLSDELAKSWTGPLGNTSTAALNVGVSQYLYQLLAGYRVLDERVAVDVLGGVAYARMDVSADLAITTGPPLLPSGARSAARREDWNDLIAGVRISAPFAERWSVVGYFDYRLSGESEDTYQAYAGANWRVTEHLSAKFGYRHLYQDYRDGDFGWDMTTAGAFLGLGIAFGADR